ncbi:MAG: hypothetical protein F4210_17415 [Holophagales bacterium]|nr:hypothetical protein [Holophagales bacterium]
MPRLNQQHDVEVAELPELPGHVDLIPLTDDGVRALSAYLGHETEVDVRVRVTDEQNSDFHKYVYGYAKERGVSFSTGIRPRFLGQRQLHQSDIDVLGGDPELPSELRPRLSCDNRFLVLKDHNFSVLPMRYGPHVSGQLYKVTRDEHAPGRSLSVSMGTLNHYRNTVDKDEAAFSVDEPSKSTWHIEGKGRVDVQTLSVGVSHSPCWIYCTTIADAGVDEAEWRGREATPIVCPIDHFAYMLGAAFGVWSKPRVREVYASIEPVEVLQSTMNSIVVAHGPVRYMDRGERNEHLRSLSERGSPLELHENLFTKRDEFAWEREYRFGVFGWGPPAQDHVILPVNKELLDCYGPPVSVG